LYSFKSPSGEYYGGEGFPFALLRSPKLARIVFYKVSKPHLNNRNGMPVSSGLQVEGYQPRPFGSSKIKLEGARYPAFHQKLVGR
jgi:hypothetical protein